MPPDEDLLPLGVYADTGATLPLVDDDTLAEFSDQPAEAAGVSPDALAAKQGHLGTNDRVSNPNDLTQTGWAIIYGASIGDDVKQALAPLIEHRRKEVANDELVKIFEGAEAFEPNDTAGSWLAKNGKNIIMEDVDPALGVPYYVLIVASPQDIPFEFQYHLDLYWAVGRIWFPTAAEYRRYAESVVEYETLTGALPASRQFSLFAPRNGVDKAMGVFQQTAAVAMTTQRKHLPPFGVDKKFRLHAVLESAATTESLDNIWSGKTPGGRPSLVFTGSHGMVFEAGDSRQPADQGAIVCEEWAGQEAPKRTHYYAGRHLPAEANFQGMIHFLFNCYGAGWPRSDGYARTLKRPAKISEETMLARFPQQLLAHKNGGALAVLGHIDRAWAASYNSPKTGPQVEGFRTFVNRLMDGHRIGHATDRLNQRWASLSIELSEMLQRKQNGIPVKLDDLKARWIIRDNARNYIVFGDPAVRLRVDKLPELSQ